MGRNNNKRTSAWEGGLPRKEEGSSGLGVGEHPLTVVDWSREIVVSRGHVVSRPVQSTC